MELNQQKIEDLNLPLKKQNHLLRLWRYFNWYEKIYLFSILAAAITLAVLFPDEEGGLMLACSLVAVVGNILCEVLITKQSRWNFLVSFTLIEVFEAIMYFKLKYYASAIITVVFWMTIDIVSFVVWSRHKDDIQKYLTKVRKLKFWHAAAMVVAIAAFGVGIGFALKAVGGEDTFLDAVTAAVGMANGMLILFRFREQWLAWYAYTILSGVLWLLGSQKIMLVLTAAFLINTTYGYVRWSLYIKKRSQKSDTKEKNQP